MFDGERMKERRFELGISIDELSDITGLTRATLYRYEKGDIKKLKNPVIEKISDILKCNPLWLMGKSEDKYAVSIDKANILYSDSVSDIKELIESILELVENDVELNYDNQPISRGIRMTVRNGLEMTLMMADKEAEKLLIANANNEPRKKSLIDVMSDAKVKRDEHNSRVDNLSIDFNEKDEFIIE